MTLLVWPNEPSCTVEVQVSHDLYGGVLQEGLAMPWHPTSKDGYTDFTEIGHGAFARVYKASVSLPPVQFETNVYQSPSP